MLQIPFTPEELQAVQCERLRHPHPRVRLKMQVLWFKSKGLPHAQICQLAGVSANTMLQYFREFLEGGIERVKQPRFYRPTSELDQHKDTIKQAFEKTLPATIQQAQAQIEELTGIRRCPTQIRKFLRRIGMQFRKVGVLPAKADPDTQAVFKKKL